MYLGIASFVHKRKVARCRKGGCGRDIGRGEPAITVVRKGANDSRSYRWFHPQCFLEWAEHLYERRGRYLAEHPPLRAGRPRLDGNTPCGDLIAEDPEAAKKRATYMRWRAKAVRLLVEEEDEERQNELVLEIVDCEEEIRKILPIQIDEPGKRSLRNRTISQQKIVAGQARLWQMSKEEIEKLRWRVTWRDVIQT